VAHACNSSYSRGRDQEDCGSKPAWANSLRLYLEKTQHTKKGLVEWLKRCSHGVQISVLKKKKKKIRGCLAREARDQLFLRGLSGFLTSVTF
jgi:hypothetical protein